MDGKKIDTPPKELELLYPSGQQRPTASTPAISCSTRCGASTTYGDSRTVDVHVKRLREKLEGVSDQWELKTVWGVGYKFEVKK